MCDVTGFARSRDFRIRSDIPDRSRRLGYHVTILRSVSGTEQPIAWSEIEALLTRFPEARLVYASGASDPTATTVVFTREGVEHCPWYTDGTLWAKTPDDQTLGIMLDIAEALQARVRGDELESYRRDGTSYFHPDDAAARRAATAAGAHWKQRRKFWIGVRLAFGAMLLVAAGLAVMRGNTAMALVLAACSALRFAIDLRDWRRL